MKIATYNINGINGRLPVLLRWLEQAQPDVVCLQELKCESSRFPEKALADAGYQAIWKGEKSWNGVAILSKEESGNCVMICRVRMIPLLTAGTSRVLPSGW